jgi:uncharacterized protein (TIGR03437 family)
MQASLTDMVGGAASTPTTVNLAPFSPGIFTTSSSGSGQGAILIANTTLLAAAQGSVPGWESRPATRGQDIVSIFCTGLGDVTNRPATGAAAPSEPLSYTLAQPTVMFGGVPVAASDVSFSGLAPSFVGLYQVNAKVPANAPTGDAVPVVINIGGINSNTATVAVN